MNAPPQAEQDDLISQLCGVTGISPAEAREYLATNNWDIHDALADYYPEQDDNMRDDLESDDEPAQSSGGRTLGGTAPPPSSEPNVRRAPRKKFATLGDLSSGDARAHDHSDDDSDEGQDMFAGGEKSGLAVQNPDDIKQKIIEKAKRAAPRPADESNPRRSYFTGAARTLGGDDTPSQFIPDPNANHPQRSPRVSRTLHFWADGFSVDDGDLYRSDDPRNQEILNGIRQGRAPLSIMNVQAGQEVDVEIKQHDEKYVKPKPKYKPFSGSGQRLGSPTPGPGTHSTNLVSESAAEDPAGLADPKVDESQPTVTFQIRLGDGTRLSTRFNTTNTIGDVYSFVAAASPASQQRPWVLMTTFPSTELTDKNAVIGELKEYKRGGVVVQKWT
ncbi:UBX domain-containing protein [Histoplasma capsulatum G186AR]|uniref:UBX domain-containing protein n=2 Tax=Ajellomyces capsulatus TaxID=5037 RepID=C0NTP5_AJECG|nr:UBX domain-containing protein [Histoplasma capsulatum G186AR]EEH05406.1 UBX domain-containing protein [Histoplasma capsulatum G186AR]KAG5305228.1 UBX domain-containing protein [Histoplasma capsulatum]QSS76189.1 UBX domain-containing protein [Histoplasma capsulatum G186AR]